MLSQKSTNILLWISLAIFLFGSGFKIGEYSTRRARSTGQSYSILNSGNAQNKANAKNIDFNLFFDAWDKLEQKYVDKSKLDSQKMFYGAIRGMVAAVDDPYTFFLTPDENKQSKDDLSGKFEGIGAQLGLKDTRVIVIAPLKDSPAAHAGLRAGDIVLKVNGESTKGWTLVQAVGKIRGAKGTKVKLTVIRENKEKDIEITRDEIKVESVEERIEKSAACKSSCKNVGYIKVNQFGETTNTEWDSSVDKIAGSWSRQEISGLVLDLRDNPGGFLESSVYLASEFVPQGNIIVKQESTVTPSHEYRVERAGKLLNIPIVVLINQGSASASEILSGALRDYGRATLVGEKSFGKGSVQEALDLSGGAGMHVTVAKWILPKGDWINGKGIQPKINIKNEVPNGNSLTREEDAQLEKAIEILVK